jgi:hypothetical protein
MTYRELLRLPQWQRKRLEIMSRDAFICQDCGTDSECLNVHHKSYAPNRMPWDYPDENFVTLCQTCHQLWHDQETDPNYWSNRDFTEEVKFTRDLAKKIESLKTINGGWTKEDLATLGIPWPPPKGWKKKLEQLSQH